mmetsp:Transcript_31900/g.30412  ORF Transcript_31900/g.30412 Transcript_31900/m.30412 type:complete len:459 (+) Transcript_31900:102-1478(+)|eukprot:CAMPEP_0119051214 /NCGR_PEP_ID=MMETSP1177-20130426/72905_1 /TAXON_ID=2985 /ORGANISM="Ochromonas sp, Strain CCMP1899" /LENGTH=458 /DNA_ID=CAMNT_0007030341 /DNA_START=96 /DNA_END=1472 /DNA_ORIENTATION=-
MNSEIFSILQNIQGRLSNIEAGLGSSTAVAQSQQGTTDVPKSVKAFDEYSILYLDPFVAACEKLGGDAQKGGLLVKDAWGGMRAYLLMASACKEPPQAALAPLLSDISIKMKDLSAAVQRNEWEKHIKTLAEGVQCLNWLLIKPAPRDFIESYIGGSDYWANNIRKEYRTSNPDQIAFCNTFKTLLLELMVYVKEQHITGVTWNPRGMEVSAYSGTSQPVAPSPASAVSTAPTTAKKGVDLFAALNKGGNITSGLKTVTKDMQTWRAEYKGEAESKVAPAASTATKAAPVVTGKAKGPAKLEFSNAGSKWLVENQSAENGVITVTIREMKESVYIYDCVGATIDIKGKCKSIVVDGCKKTKVLFETAMASCEVINCQRMQIQCREKVSAVAIDKTDGIIVFLPTTSLDTEIVASKSSEMNLSWPDEKGDMIERPIPEQFKHHIQGLTVTAEVSDLYTH